ncbi:MAG: hypothetical protein NTX25_17740 [Proteobacteria bacterium]|nr:hypothetical protein [Pseudomonadota bacterium]
MAENKSIDPGSPLDESAAVPLEDGNESTAMTDSIGFVQDAADENTEDTLESPSLQAELVGQAENPEDFNMSKKISKDETLNSRGLAAEVEASQRSHSSAAKNSEDVKKDDKEERLLDDLANARQALLELMAWKNDLRLVAMHHNTLGSYYEHWTKEANLFFRRVVIINKRLETYRKKKRA